jgi:hypothetical protein
MSQGEARVWQLGGAGIMRLLAGLSENSSSSLKPFHPLIADSESGASFFQLANLLEQIQRATIGAKKLVLGRSASDLTGRLEPGSWSAAECLDHLAQTTRSFLPAISKAVATAPKLTTNRPFRTGTIALLLVRNLEPPYRFRYKVLPELVPQEKNFEAAWSAFEESQSWLSESVLSATGLAIDKVKVQCPVHARVTYNVYGAFRMLAAHERRHLWQIEQILKGLNETRVLKAAV